MLFQEKNKETDRDFSEGALWWLAGLLEGEGSFDFQCRTSENRNGRIRIQLATTDYDVAERVAYMLGVKVNGPYKQSGIGKLPTYRVMKSGVRIFPLWSRLYPLMGKRRQEQMVSAWARVQAQRG